MEVACAGEKAEFGGKFRRLISLYTDGKSLDTYINGGIPEIESYVQGGRGDDYCIAGKFLKFCLKLNYFSTFIALVKELEDEEIRKILNSDSSDGVSLLHFLVYKNEYIDVDSFNRIVKNCDRFAIDETTNETPYSILRYVQISDEKFESLNEKDFDIREILDNGFKGLECHMMEDIGHKVIDSFREHLEAKKDHLAKCNAGSIVRYFTDHMDEVIKVFVKERDSAKENLRSTEEKLNKAEDTIKANDNKINEHKKYINEQEKYINDMLLVIKDMQNRNEVLEGENDNMKKQCISYEEEISKINQEKNVIKEENLRYEKEISKLKREIEDMRRQCTSYEGKISKVNQEKSAIKEENLRYEKEISKLKREIEDMQRQCTSYVEQISNLNRITGDMQRQPTSYTRSMHNSSCNMGVSGERVKHYGTTMLAAAPLYQETRAQKRLRGGYMSGSSVVRNEDGRQSRSSIGSSISSNKAKGGRRW